jgi:hypothetical protein
VYRAVCLTLDDNDNHAVRCTLQQMMVLRPEALMLLVPVPALVWLQLPKT